MKSWVWLAGLLWTEARGDSGTEVGGTEDGLSGACDPDLSVCILDSVVSDE